MKDNCYVHPTWDKELGIKNTTAVGRLGWSTFLETQCPELPSYRWIPSSYIIRIDHRNPNHRIPFCLDNINQYVRCSLKCQVSKSRWLLGSHPMYWFTSLQGVTSWFLQPQKMQDISQDWIIHRSRRETNIFETTPTIHQKCFMGPNPNGPRSKFSLRLFAF